MGDRTADGLAGIARLAASVEESFPYHLGRLLVLMSAFGSEKANGSVGGLMKLAKLDFLLRYPVYLERALAVQGGNPQRVEVRDYERSSVESAMTRYRYGPWDDRYRAWVNVLVALDLAQVSMEGRRIVIGLTDEGQRLGETLSEDEAFADQALRARILKTRFDLTGTNLAKFIYKYFPEVVSLRMGDTIGYADADTDA